MKQEHSEFLTTGLNLAKVRMLNAKEEWMVCHINPETVQYVHKIDERGILSDHYVVGFHQREFVIHHQDIALLFEI